MRMEPDDDAEGAGGACATSGPSFRPPPLAHVRSRGGTSCSGASASAEAAHRCSTSWSTYVISAGPGGDVLTLGGCAARDCGVGVGVGVGECGPGSQQRVSSDRRRAAGSPPRTATLLAPLLMLFILLLCAPGVRAFSGAAFSAAPVISQPLVNVFRVDVTPAQPLPDVLQRVYLELWSDGSGFSGFNVTLFDDATKSVAGVVTTYLPVTRTWLDGVWARSERAYVRAHAFVADAPSPPGKPYQIAQSNKLAVAAATPWDAGDPFNGTAKGQLIAGCRVRAAAHGGRKGRGVDGVAGQ
jgi:hypothetical protein